VAASLEKASTYVFAGRLSRNAAVSRAFASKSSIIRFRKLRLYLYIKQGRMAIRVTMALQKFGRIPVTAL